MVKCRGAIPFITVAKSKRYCKGVKSIASELTFTTKSNTFYSLSIPFTFSTVIKGIAFSIFNIRRLHQSWKKSQSWQSGLGNALAIWGTFLLEIYAGLSNFGICRDLRTFEIIFRLNVGKILNDWEKLGNIDLKILLFCLNFPPKFLYGSDWGIFWWIVCNNMKITLFCRFDYWTRFTHFGEHFWPTVLDWGTLLHFFQLCLHRGLLARTGKSILASWHPSLILFYLLSSYPPNSLASLSQT